MQFYQAQAGILDTITSGGGAVGDAMRAIAEDPALVPFSNRIVTLNSLEKKKAASGGGGSGKGVGLSSFLGPLDAYIFIKKNPWALPAIGLVAYLVIKKLRKR